MRSPAKSRFLAALAIGALPAACTVENAPIPRLPPPAALAQDQAQPVLALFEHVLTGYFAGAGPNTPTTCAALRPRPLGAAQEQALIKRFVRLAPASRCAARPGGKVDDITGAVAAVIEVSDFACRSEVLCAGSVTVPGKPAVRYALRFVDGAWRVEGDAVAGSR
jgi:hypothetical protein